ncbi:hypothetical protein B7463_g8707, partial [Scytalidium lignicola]
MGPPQQTSGEEAPRKRKAHKKSRGGCRNCKLRRIKCDEARPDCQRCVAFRVSCNYNAKTPDLHTGPDQVLEFDTPATNTVMKPTLKPPRPFNRSSLPMSIHAYPFVIGDKDHIIELDARSLDRFKRFQVRTVLTVGTPNGSQLFQKIMPQLAFAHPYLMHIVQAITAAHDRYLSPSSPSKQSFIESYHLSWGTALFSAKLSGPLEESDRDPLWASAALLGAVVSSAIEASTPEEAWPLKKPESTDLEWLKMSESKSVIWQLTDPLRDTSLFRPVSGDWTTDLFRLPQPPSRGTEGVLPAFISVFELDEYSTADNNPYYTEVHGISTLLNLPRNRSTVIRFLSFASHMQPEFKILMQKKDHRALLLLSYWYAMVIEGLWWIARRARLECQAICLYLERECINDRDIFELLEYPKIGCGLAT